MLEQQEADCYRQYINVCTSLAENSINSDTSALTVIAICHTLWRWVATSDAALHRTLVVHKPNLTVHRHIPWRKGLSSLFII